MHLLPLALGQMKVTFLTLPSLQNTCEHRIPDVVKDEDERRKKVGAILSQ